VSSVHPAPRVSFVRNVVEAARLWWCRVAVFLFRGRLDAELASGADPASDRVLTLRARQLLTARHRRRIGVSVQRLVDDLDSSDPGSYLSSAVPFQLEQVAEARATLLSLAGALRDVDPVNPLGVAMALRLITDPESPLYVPAATGALELRAHAALRSLLAETHPWCELPDVAAVGPGAPNGNR
jgi:hypothetical protein